MANKDQLTVGSSTYTLAYADAMPPLPDALYDALRDSIDDIGIQTPILVDQNKTVLDGHQRLRIAAELDLPPEEIPLRVHSMPQSDEARFRAAVELNTKRRQAATPDQRRRWIAQIRIACQRRNRPIPSSHDLGRYFGVSHTTILRDLRALDAANDEALERARKRKNETQLRVTYLNKAARWLEEDSAEISGDIDMDAATAALQQLLERAKAERDLASEKYKQLTEDRQGDETNEPQTDASVGPRANAEVSSGDDPAGDGESDTDEPTQASTEMDGSPEPTAPPQDSEAPSSKTSAKPDQGANSALSTDSADAAGVQGDGADIIKQIENLAATADGTT